MSQKIIYIVATPIGTLADFSNRAKDILSSSLFIACEDTRHSYKLLQHFDIKAQLESLHEHNEKEKCKFLLEKLLNSQATHASIITDAGTPCISDPGSFLIQEAHLNKIKVLNIPGPSSLVCALASSGFIQPRTIFSGFIARNKQEQTEEFARWKKIAPCIAVFFESPKRLLDSIINLDNYFKDPNLKICVSKEISKKFEEHIFDNIKNVIDKLNKQEEILGEFVVSVNLQNESAEQQILSFDDILKNANRFIELGFAPKDAAKKACENSDFNPKQIYQSLMNAKKQ